MELIHIGLAVRTARKAAHMSAKELAEEIMITATTLSKIETGKQTLDFKTAIAIAKALNISVAHLAALAEEVSCDGADSDRVRNELRGKIKELEKMAIKKALFLINNKHLG